MPPVGPFKPIEAARAAPRTNCPITGELIRYREVGADKMWVAFTSLWTTRMFQFKDQLVRALSYCNGVEPLFPRNEVVVVRDDNEPPGPAHPIGE